MAAIVGAVVVACTSQSNLVLGGQVVVALIDPFISVNADTSFGRGSQANADVAMLTSAGFGRGALRLPVRSMYQD